MSAATPAATLAVPAKWDAKEYRRMVSASYRDGKLLVLFEDRTRGRPRGGPRRAAGNHGSTMGAAGGVAV